MVLQAGYRLLVAASPAIFYSTCFSPLPLKKIGYNNVNTSLSKFVRTHREGDLGPVLPGCPEVTLGQASL